MVSSSTKSLHNRQLAEINRLKYEARQAADTIERQAKEIAEFNTEANRLVAINRELIRERDAALAEVERLKASLETQLGFPLSTIKVGEIAAIWTELKEYGDTTAQFPEDQQDEFGL